MNNKIYVYGLSDAQQSVLDAALPEGYNLEVAECATDLIVGNPVCTIIDAADMSEDSSRVLLSYYMDVGDQLDETVVWLGNADLPNLPSFVRCDDFLQLLLNIKEIMSKAQDRYDIMAQYTDMYSYLPKHAIAECLEAEIFSLLDTESSRQFRWAWIRLLGTENGPELLAAVYELTRWMKREKIDYTLKFHAPWDELLLFWHGIKNIEFTAEHEENYVVYVRQSDLEKTKNWLANHWYFRNPDPSFKVCTFEGLETGIATLDFQIQGIKPGEVILIGGRPAMGKTSFAQGVAEYVAKTRKVLVFDLEEGGWMHAENINVLTGCFEVPQIWNVTEKEKPDLLIIDRFQRIPEIMDGGPYQTVMRAIKKLAKDMRIPVIITTDLSRDIKERLCPVPCEHDIPAHNLLLPYADTVLLLYRPAYYDPELDRSLARINVPKAANISHPYRTVSLHWDDENHRFTD